MLDHPADKEASIIKQARQNGKPLPARIANAPELLPGLQLYLQAFFDLDAERSHGFSLSQIPWSKIKEYSKDLELDEEQTDDMLFFIRKMDSAHLKRLDARSKNK